MLVGKVMDYAATIENKTDMELYTSFFLLHFAISRKAYHIIMSLTLDAIELNKSEVFFNLKENILF